MKKAKIGKSNYNLPTHHVHIGKERRRHYSHGQRRDSDKHDGIIGTNNETLESDVADESVGDEFDSSGSEGTREEGELLERAAALEEHEHVLRLRVRELQPRYVQPLEDIRFGIVGPRVTASVSTTALHKCYDCCFAQLYIKPP